MFFFLSGILNLRKILHTALAQCFSPNMTFPRISILTILSFQSTDTRPLDVQMPQCWRFIELKVFMARFTLSTCHGSKPINNPLYRSKNRFVIQKIWLLFLLPEEATFWGEIQVFVSLQHFVAGAFRCGVDLLFTLALLGLT